MKKALFSLFLILFLTGCASGPGKFITWTEMEHAELQKMCERSFMNLRGCAKMMGASCYVYTVREKDDLRRHETLGHEVRHCFYGNFHP